MADRRKKPGLMLRATSLEIETVSARMKKPCDQCGKILKPGEKRVKLSFGAGRHATQVVLCHTHGYDVVKQLRAKAEIAMAFIGDDEAEAPESDIRLRSPVVKAKKGRASVSRSKRGRSGR